MRDAPDDTETNEMIRDSEDLIEALFEIADKYGADVTNNWARWQDGVYFREFSEFVGDIRAAYARWPHVAELDSKNPTYINYWREKKE